MNNKIDIHPIPDHEADKRRLCEIRFDCLVAMHDSGTRSIGGGMLGVTKDLPPQWFRSLSTITLEELKYGNEVELGARLKQMYYELQAVITRYEQYR